MVQPCCRKQGHSLTSDKSYRSPYLVMYSIYYRRLLHIYLKNKCGDIYEMLCYFLKIICNIYLHFVFDIQSIVFIKHLRAMIITVGYHVVCYVMSLLYRAGKNINKLAYMRESFNLLSSETFP